VNAPDEIYITPVHLACQWNMTVLNKLITKGGDIYTLDNNGCSCLHFAANSSNDTLEVLKFLVLEGLEVNTIDAKENTPLHLATKWGHINNVKVLVDLGTDLTITTDKGQTFLHYAAESTRDNSNVIKLFASKGLDVIEKVDDDDENTPLHLASIVGNINNVKTLVGLGADISAVNSKRQSCLHYAAKGTSDNSEVIKILDSKGLNVNAKDRLRDTALHFAAKYGHINNLKELVCLGADIFIKNKYRKIASDVCNTKEKKAILEITKVLLDM